MKNKFIPLILLATLASGCSLHDHIFSNEWSSDGEYHWHDATCEHNELASGLAKHIDMDSDFVCDVCKRVLHTHTFNTDDWSTNETSHWHESTCEHKDLKSDLGEHEYDATGFCKVCGFENPEIIRELVFNAKNLSYVGSSKFHIGDEIALIVSPDEDYRLPAELDITGLDDFSYNNESGLVTGVVNDDVVINGKAIKIEYKYIITKEIHNDLINNGVDICEWNIDVQNKTSLLNYYYTRYGVTEFDGSHVEQFNSDNLVTFKAYKDKDGNIQSSETYSYNEDNKISEIEYIFNSEYKNDIYEYNDSGKIKTISHYYYPNSPSEAKLSHKYTYTYEEGKEYEYFESYNSGGEVVQMALKETSYSFDLQLNTYSVTAKEYFGLDKKEERCFKETYDINTNNILEYVDIDSDSEYRTKYTYNENNDLVSIEEFIHTDDGDESWTSQENTYDSNGLLVLSKNYSKDNLGVCFLYNMIPEYDSNNYISALSVLGDSCNTYIEYTNERVEQFDFKPEIYFESRTTSFFSELLISGPF